MILVLFRGELIIEWDEAWGILVMLGCWGVYVEGWGVWRIYYFFKDCDEGGFGIGTVGWMGRVYCIIYGVLGWIWY